MKISQRFALNKSQAELDFVDINSNADTPLFLDPFFLGIRTDKWSYDATLTVKSFFQKLLDLIRAGRKNEAKHLFRHLHEPNATCLGLSIGRPKGSGVGGEDADKIYENLLESKAIQTGLIQDIEDNVLFVDNFGKDKLSDMTTNIIRKHLIDYTQAQCNLHNIQLNPSVPSGFYWSRQKNDWVSEYADQLVIDGKPILLVPKAIVSFSEEYTPERYYQHFVLNFLQNEHLDINSVLVRERKNGEKYVTKKDLKKDNPQSKEFLRKFTQEHPEVLETFKRETTNDSLRNQEISDINLKEVCKYLGEKLVSIPAGTKTASDFHNVIKGILELLFYPDLMSPVKEQEIHSGRKRIDISFDNAAKSGVFNWLPEKLKLFCPYIFIECKNYSSDPANPELDQLSGRFSVNRGKFGFLVCRNFEDRKLFIERCRDTYNDGRGLIVPLADQDIINLLDNHDEFNNSFIDKYLSDIVREIVMN